MVIVRVEGGVLIKTSAAEKIPLTRIEDVAEGLRAAAKLPVGGKVGVEISKKNG